MRENTGALSGGAGGSRRCPCRPGKHVALRGVSEVDYQKGKNTPCFYVERSKRKGSYFATTAAKFPDLCGCLSAKGVAPPVPGTFAPPTADNMLSRELGLQLA